MELGLAPSSVILVRNLRKVGCKGTCHGQHRVWVTLHNSVLVISHSVASPLLRILPMTLLDMCTSSQCLLCKCMPLEAAPLHSASSPCLLGPLAVVAVCWAPLWLLSCGWSHSWSPSSSPLAVCCLRLLPLGMAVAKGHLHSGSHGRTGGLEPVVTHCGCMLCGCTCVCMHTCVYGLCGVSACVVSCAYVHAWIVGCLCICCTYCVYVYMCMRWCVCAYIFCHHDNCVISLCDIISHNLNQR